LTKSIQKSSAFAASSLLKILSHDLFQLLIGIYWSIKPFRSLDVLDAAPLIGVPPGHSFEQELEVLVNLSTIIDDGLDGFPEVDRVIKQQLKHILILNFLFFGIRHVLKLQKEQHNGHRIDIGLHKVIIKAFRNLRSPIVHGSLAKVLLLADDPTEIEVNDLQLVVFPDKDVLKLEIKVSYLVCVEELHAADELVEICSGKLFISGYGLVIENINNVAIGGQLHDDHGAFHITVVVMKGHFVHGLDHIDDILVFEIEHVLLVGEEWVNAFVLLERVAFDCDRHSLLVGVGFVNGVFLLGNQTFYFEGLV